MIKMAKKLNVKKMIGDVEVTEKVYNIHQIAMDIMNELGYVTASKIEERTTDYNKKQIIATLAYLAGKGLLEKEEPVKETMYISSKGVA